MEDWKKEYDNIKVPEEMREKLEQSINRAKKEKKRMKDVETKKRTHRLCQIGGAVESVLGSAIEEDDFSEEGWARRAPKKK